MELKSVDDSELQRVYTFLNWPSAAAVSPLSLARHGFIYIGPPGARTQCVLCRLFVDNWSRGDNPFEIHRERSPLCPFVKSANTGNESTNSTQVASPKSCWQNARQCAGNDRSDGASLQSATKRGDVLARWHPCSSQTLQQGMQTANSGSAVCLVADSYDRSAEPLQTVTNQLRVNSGTTLSRDSNRQTSDIIGQRTTTTNNSTFSQPTGNSSENPRIRSFSSGKVSPGQTAYGLAAAGFYYVGPEDNVRCFWCNGGLKNFLQTDDPQTEHRRWFPQCSFIQNNRTEQFNEPSNITSNNAASQTSVAVAAATNSATCGRLFSIEESESTLLEENKQLNDSRTCKICMDAIVDTVFLPCGHLVSCSNCSHSLRNCAVCRALIRGTVKIFMG